MRLRPLYLCLFTLLATPGASAPELLEVMQHVYGKS